MQYNPRSLIQLPERSLNLYTMVSCIGWRLIGKIKHTNQLWTLIFLWKLSVKTIYLENLTLESPMGLVLSGESFALAKLRPEGGYRVCWVNEDVEIWHEYEDFDLGPPTLFNLDYIHSVRTFRNIETLIPI